MPTPEELLELMIHEYKTGIICQDYSTTVRHAGRIEALEVLKKRIDNSKQPWEVRSLADYESQS